MITFYQWIYLFTYCLIQLLHFECFCGIFWVLLYVCIFFLFVCFRFNALKSWYCEVCIKMFYWDSLNAWCVTIGFNLKVIFLFCVCDLIKRTILFSRLFCRSDFIQWGVWETSLIKHFLSASLRSGWQKTSCMTKGVSRRCVGPDLWPPTSREDHCLNTDNSYEPDAPDEEFGKSYCLSAPNVAFRLAVKCVQIYFSCSLFHSQIIKIRPETPSVLTWFICDIYVFYVQSKGIMVLRFGKGHPLKL